MFTIALMYTVLFKLCPTRSTTIQKATHYQRNHRQGEDDEEDDEEATTVTVAATAATGEGNDRVGSIPILLVLVCQRRKRNQINDIKLM